MLADLTVSSVNPFNDPKVLYGIGHRFGIVEALGYTLIAAMLVPFLGMLTWARWRRDRGDPEEGSTSSA